MHSLPAHTRMCPEHRPLYSVSGPAQYFQEKLQDFYVAFGFGQVLPPRVKSMAAKKESVNGWIAFQQSLDLLRQSRNVLAILKDRKDFAMLMRVDVAQALEHLETFESHGAIA